MKPPKNTSFLRSILASWTLEIKIGLLIVVVGALGAGIMLWGADSVTFVIEHYYPEYSSSLHDKHSIVAGIPLIVPFVLFIILANVFLMPMAKLIAKYKIKGVRQQSHDKITGIARITVDDWTNEKENLLYVTVPDRQGRLWTFRFASVPKSFKHTKEGTFPAEIYFRDAVEYPSLVVIGGTREFLPENTPEMKDAPRRPPPKAVNYREIILSILFFIFIASFFLFGLLSDLFSILSNPSISTPEALSKVAPFLLGGVIFILAIVIGLKRFFGKSKKSPD